MADMIVSPKKFWEFCGDIHFLVTGFGEGYFMGVHIVCPDWTQTYANFRTEEALKELKEFGRCQK